jgi:CheY-like chemotaxis protein
LGIVDRFGAPKQGLSSVQKVGPDLPRLPSILRVHNKAARVLFREMFTFVLLCGTTLPARRSRMELSWGQSVLELPVILVIEDDEQIQSLVEDALIEGGFEPAIAASGEEAVTLLKSSSFIKERPVTYRALATDINLKGMMNGWEVAKQAREIDPGFPVVYMTGAAADQWGSHGVPNSILLRKPFAPAQLVTAVSQLLNTGMPDN